MSDGFVNRELSRIQSAIPRAQAEGDSGLVEKLLIAQQALVWALDPHTCYASPYAMITGEKDPPLAAWPASVSGPMPEPLHDA